MTDSPGQAYRLIANNSFGQLPGQVQRERKRNTVKGQLAQAPNWMQGRMLLEKKMEPRGNPCLGVLALSRNQSASIVRMREGGYVDMFCACLPLMLP